MSTPSGKPVDPFDPSGVSHETHECAGVERHPVENDHGPLQSPYVPKKARAQPAGEQDFAIREDSAPLAPLRASEGLREHSERRAVDVHESYLFSHDALGAPCAPGRPPFDEQDGRNHSTRKAFEEIVPEQYTVDLHPVASIQPDHAGNSPHQEQPAAAASCDEIVRDLKRLAASVRWVQRAEAAARLPRAAQLPPVPGLAPVDARGRGEMFDNGFWSPRSLELERLVPPSAMRSRRGTLRGLLIILIVSIFAAPVAYYLSAGGWGPTPKPPLGPQIASFDSKFITPPLRSSSHEDSRTIIAQDDAGTPAEGEISSERSKLSPTAKSFASETVATLRPGTAGVQAPPSSTAVRALDPEEIKLLMKQGKQFIAAGDVVTARLPFQRAAEAGDADAAVALGATYDPTVLAKLGAVGISADVAKARSWYQKAEKFGSPEARWRLDSIADR
jgi:hypothetical protein